MDLEEQKRRIAALAAIEQGGGDISRLNMESPEVTAPRMPLMSRTVAVPGVAQDSTVPDSGVAGVRDEEMEAAKNLDNKSQSDRLFEAATRQLIAGLTRTPVAQTLTQPTQNTAELIAKRRMARADALKELELGTTIRGQDLAAQRNVALDKRHEVERAQDLAERRIDNERAWAGQEAQGKRTEEAAKRQDMLLGLAFKNSNLAEKRADIAERRETIKEGGLKPRGDWEPLDPNAMTFRTSADASKFDAADAAFGALQNHTLHAKEALKKFKEAQSLSEKDKWLSIANQQMANIASKLRVAEGLNSSDQSNHAVETMLGLTDGSILNFRNMANEGRLEAILDSGIESARTNLNTLAKSNNLQRRGGGEVPSGRVTVSNGKETLIIEASDLKDAEADGYRRVK